MTALMDARTDTPAAWQRESSRGKDVLLVDAYDDSRQALADLLRESGFRVREASNDVHGFRLTRRSRPDLVIVDPWPFFSGGVDPIERLPRLGFQAGIPVLVLTSIPGGGYRERAHDAGCSGYLEKPCPPESLLHEIDRILSAAAHSTGGVP